MKAKTLTKKEKEELQKEFPELPKKKKTRRREIEIKKDNWLMKILHRPKKSYYYMMQNAKVVLVYTLILIIVLGAILGFIWALLQIICLAKFIW